jgi:hypothetical protein
MHRHDMAGILRILFDLLPELCHMKVDGQRVWQAMLTPDSPKQVVSRPPYIWISEKKFEKGELPSR